MHSGMTFVTARYLRMVRGLFMLTCIVMFGRFTVVLGSVGTVF
jgi:hypothetical protein